MNKKQMRAAKIREQQALTSLGRDLTAEEQAQFDALQREIDALTLEIEAEEAARAEETAETSEPAEDMAQRAIADERERVASINDLCRTFDVDSTSYIRNGSTIDQVRAAILDGLRNTSRPASVQVTRDEQDTFRARATDALMLRAGLDVETPADGAQQLRAMSLRDLGIECLSR